MPVRSKYVSLTAAAEGSLASYDRVTDDPALQCVKPGMPSTMSNPHPMHFVDGGDRITVNIQENDVVRTIYIGENAEAATQPPGPLGYSVGHWEDTTLVVHTTRINWPYFDRTGIPGLTHCSAGSSGSIVLRERSVLQMPSKLAALDNCDALTTIHSSNTLASPALGVFCRRVNTPFRLIVLNSMGRSSMIMAPISQSV